MSSTPPFTVRLKFHGDLNLFLTHRAGDGVITRELRERTSIKDAFEACGVPHPEVDLILVDGAPVDFAYVLDKTADVDLWPAQNSPASFAKDRLQSSHIEKFVADGHLGKLARNLRLLGFDVAYDAHAQDRQLLDLMVAENRALLTRDRRLLMHKIVQHGCYPRSQDAVTQTIEIIRRFDLVFGIAPFTRCVRCNAPLEGAAKSDVIEELEPLTKVYYEEFRRCTGCRQIYWRGSHFDKLSARVEEIRAQLRV